MVIMKAKIANLNHFQNCLATFLAWFVLVAGLTQKGLTVLLAAVSIEKEKGDLVLMLKSE
jgi:hypothetical protein